MLLINEQLKTGLGKSMRVLYYAALIWGLLWTGIGTSITVQKLTVGTVIGAILMILILGVLPALGCYFLAIRVDRWRMKKLDDSPATGDHAYSPTPNFPPLPRRRRIPVTASWTIGS